MSTSLMLLIACAAAAGAPPTSEPVGPYAQGQRVYTTGHGHHYFVGDLLPGIGKSVKQTQVGVNFIGMANTQKLWDRWKNRPLLALISERKIDVMTTATMEKLDGGLDLYAEYAREYHPEMPIVVQEGWLIGPSTPTNHRLKKVLERRQKFFTALAERITALNAKLEEPRLFVAPAAHAHIALRELVLDNKVPGIESQGRVPWTGHESAGHLRPLCRDLRAKPRWHRIALREAVEADEDPRARCSDQPIAAGISVGRGDEPSAERRHGQRLKGERYPWMRS